MLKEADLNSTKQPRPQLDDFERLLCESVKENLCVELTTWEDGFFTLRGGTVTKIDSYERKVFILDESHSEYVFSFFEIVDIKTN